MVIPSIGITIWLFTLTFSNVQTVRSTRAGPMISDKEWTATTRVRGAKYTRANRPDEASLPRGRSIQKLTL